MSNEKPVIFQYEDYRKYLKDIYEFFKRESRFFSYRYFSKAAGFRSPNILKLVIEGQRNISKKSIPQFSKALKHNKSESEFFSYLVQFNQAKTVHQKQKMAELLSKHKAYMKFHPLTHSQLRYYSHWFYVPIRELVGMSGFKYDPQWISEKLSPKITLKQAELALKDLKDLELIKKNKDNLWVQSSSDVSAANAVGSSFVAHYHKEMLRLAAESIERFGSDQREISSSTVMVSQENFKKVKLLIQNFRDELVAITSEDAEGDMVCQIGLQLFPLTHKREVS